jgi:hypothetical protein
MGWNPSSSRIRGGVPGVAGWEAFCSRLLRGRSWSRMMHRRSSSPTTPFYAPRRLPNPRHSVRICWSDSTAWPFPFHGIKTAQPLRNAKTAELWTTVCAGFTARATWHPSTGLVRNLLERFVDLSDQMRELLLLVLTKNGFEMLNEALHPIAVSKESF